MRITAGANAWRKVEGYMIALETMALTETQQEKVQVCENNLVRIIVGNKRVIVIGDRREMDGMRVEVGVKKGSKKKLVR